LVQLHGQRAIDAGESGEVYLRFGRDSARVVGSTGCNGLSASYTRNGAALYFGRAVTTRVASLDERRKAQEGAFLAAIRATERHEIAGNTLTLNGSSGPLARLVAIAK